MRVSAFYQPAREGFQVRSGVRQSMPSISIASCAVSVTVPPGGALGRQRAHHPLQSLYVVRRAARSMFMTARA
jgi:hypothetical protein